MYNNQNSTTSGYIGVPGVSIEVASDVPRISREMGMIQKLLAEHGEVAAMLEQRLNAVLRPANPQAVAEGGSAPRPAASPLTSDLEGFRDQLSLLFDHYNEILSRLEV